MATIFKRLRAQRFTGFLDTGVLNFSHINIFIGPNSAGKSSLLHIPLILKQTFDDINPENRLITDGKLVGMGSFTDAIYGHDDKQSIGFDMTFGISHIARHLFMSSAVHRNGNVAPVPDGFAMEFGTTSRAKRTFIKSFKLHRDGKDIVEGTMSPSGKLKTWQSPLVSSVDRNVVVDFFHFAPYASYRGRPTERILSEMRRFSLAMYDFRQVCAAIFSSVVHLQPIRTPIRAADRLTGESPVSVGGTGENLLGVLYRDEKRGRSKRRLLSHLNYWLDKKFNLVKDVHIEPLTKSGSLFALTGKDSRSNIDINLAAVGFGVSQVAPIIVQGFLSLPNTAIIIEQPEIHLHPAAQAELGDLFIQLAEAEKQLFIETHSQYLLFRIQRRIAEGALDAKKVRVFFVSRQETGSVVKQLELDERGRILDWPAGFFEEGYTETAATAEALTK